MEKKSAKNNFIGFWIHISDNIVFFLLLAFNSLAVSLHVEAANELLK